MFDRVKKAWVVWMTDDFSCGCPPGSTFGYDRTGGTSKKSQNKREVFTINCAIHLQQMQIERCDALRMIKSRDASRTPSST